MAEPLIERSAAFGEVVAALAGAQKSNRNAPAYSRWVNRPVGRIFAAAAYKAGWTPNGVTAISAVFTFAGIAVLAFGPGFAWIGVAAATLLVLGYALDSADGQLARLRGGGSLAGEWLDHVVDATKVVSFHLALAWRFSGWWVAMLFAIQASVWFFGIVLTEVLGRVRGAAKPDGPAKALNSWLGIPADYGFLCLLMLLLGFPDLFRPVYTLLMAGNVGLLLVQSVRWYRRVRSWG